MMLPSLQNFLRPGGGVGETVELPPAGGMPGVSGPAAPAGAPKASFGNVLSEFVTDVNSKMDASNSEQAKLLAGDTSNLHQAMISMQEASTAFSLMVEVRNKLVDGYQELMRMQV